MFNTVLFNLRSAKNVGMIARSHIAFGGNFLILIGDKKKWSFKGGTSTYTRKINDAEKLLFFENFEEFINWNKLNFNGLNIAIEIDENAKKSNHYKFIEKCNIILGNERTGIESNYLNQCDQIITIPQLNPIGSLNVAISASIIFYEICKESNTKLTIEEFKFRS